VSRTNGPGPGFSSLSFPPGPFSHPYSRVAEKGSSRKLGFRCMEFPETKVPAFNVFSETRGEDAAEPVL